MTLACDWEASIQLLLPLTNLTQLYVCASRFTSGANFREHPSIKSLICNDRAIAFPSPQKGIGLGISDEHTCISKYDGEWNQDKRHGHGSIWYPVWKHEDQYGMSPYLLRNPLSPEKPQHMWGPGYRIYGAQWIQEQEMKPKNWICLYEGQWESNLKHGVGTFFFKDGSKWNGKWDQGRCTGEGTFESKTGKTKKVALTDLLGSQYVSLFCSQPQFSPPIDPFAQEQMEVGEKP